MKRYIVTAAASPLFRNFLMLVSVSNSEDGSPIQNLKATHFYIHHLASFNHAHPNDREIKSVSESPKGFYTLLLSPEKSQSKLPAGHYVFSVAVKKPHPVIGQAGQPLPDPTEFDYGQTIAVGDLPE